MLAARSPEPRFWNSQVKDELYTVLDLPPAQFRQAYPLVQILGTNWTLDQWLDHARRLCGRPDKGCGIVSVQTRPRHIYAFATYEIHSRQTEALSIRVDHMCVVDFLSQTVRYLMLEALERRGLAGNCVEIVVNLPEAADMSNWQRQRSLGPFLQSLGYVRTDDLLAKRLR